MKTLRFAFAMLVLCGLAGGMALLIFRPQWIKPAPAEEKEEEGEKEVPVKVDKVKRMTLHRWIAGYGYAEAEPALEGKPPASALVASPVAGTVAQVACEPGKLIEPGALLIQLDDRLAAAAEEQAKAVLASAEASLKKLRATPRPEQVDLAQLSVDKAREGLEFARKAFERQKSLSKDQAVSAKVIEAAGRDVEVAQNDLKVAEKQLALLKASPAPEEIAEASGKVHEAEKALCAAQVQRSLLQIRSPLKATVMRILVSPGESVDPTKPLVELVAMDRLVVNVAVPSDQVSLVKLGQEAEITARMSSPHEEEKHESPETPTTKPAESPASKPANPEVPAIKPAATEPSTKPAEAHEEHEPELKGTVRLIGYQVDRKSNTVSVLVSLPANAEIRPGRFLRVKIEVEEHAGVLAVPSRSVVHTEDDKTAIHIVHGEKSQCVLVKPGLQEDEWTEVSGDGFKEGDVVVTEGAYGLPKETQVKILGQ